jgi:hypothetical protein
MQLISYKDLQGYGGSTIAPLFPSNAHITWREFTDAFHGVYIPPGLIEIKLEEFLSLNQGTKTMT